MKGIPLIIFIFYFFLVMIIQIFSEPQHSNMSAPYEWLSDYQALFQLQQFSDVNLKHFSLQVRGEFSVASNGFISEQIEGTIGSGNDWSKKVNPLSYLGEFQNAIASFYGSRNTTFADQYPFFGGNTTNYCYSPNGKVAINSLIAAVECWCNEYFKIGWYLPYYWINLSNVSVVESRGNSSYFEAQLTPNLLSSFQKNGGIAITNELVNGIGDSQVLVSWQRNFFEERAVIREITCAARLGGYLPTGKSVANIQDTILKIPLGFDSSWGISYGGNIQITLSDIIDVGVVADCTNFFGSYAVRYLYNDIRQTSLLESFSAPSYLDPGMKEEFSVYLSGHNPYRSFLLTLAYQYNKQQESTVTVNPFYSPSIIANSSRFYEAWTTHHLIAQIAGHFENDFFGDWLGGAFIKYGFNGTRSIVVSTIGLSLSAFF